MKDSPFLYGSTVSSVAFTNREDEITKLKSNLLNGINTTLISPRRWGKSSLVEKVINDINKKEKKTKTVIIDLFSVGSTEEFLERYAREVIKASSTKWQEWLQSGKEFFKKLVPTLSVGIDPHSDFSLSFDWKELSKHADEVLNLPEKIAESKGLKFIICIDEFQNLATYPEYETFEKKLRASWQRHKLVTYCLYGSKRHMMTDIFNNSSKPFYRFGDIMMLPKIKKEKWISFIVSSFASTGKAIDKTQAQLIPQLMKNHSWYVQQLSHYTWNVTHKKAGLKEIQAALNELIQANTPLYQHQIEWLSATQVNFMKAVAQGETKFTSTSAMLTFKLGTPRNVSKNKSILIENDIIHEIDGKFEFLDPAFEIWFNNQFYNIPYNNLILNS
jgi:uncharacterized protein